MAGDTRRLTYLISTLEVGGAQRGMARLIDDLLAEYEVTVIALRGMDHAIVPELPDEIDIIDLAVNDPWQVTRLTRLYRHLGTTDVLVCSMYHAGIVGNLFGRVARVPTIVTWRHLAKYNSPFRERLYSFAISSSDRILADSRTVAERLEENHGLSSERICTVPIAGIDTVHFSPQSGSASDTTVVGVLGRLVDQKNHDAVLDLADKLRNEPIRFEIAGQGPRERILRRRVEEDGLDNVQFEGFVDDVPDFLNGLDVYIQPSINEGLCMTAVEAMACGLPVVAYAVGGLTETVIDGETGFLVEPGNEDELVERLQTLVEDPDLRHQFGAAGRERVVDNYSQDVLVSTFRDALDSALEK